MNIETRTEYRSLNESIENGELVAEATFDAMVTFAKAKKMKRPTRPESFFVEAPVKPAPKAKSSKPAADKPMSRKECVARLTDLGYDGPTSYLMPVLRHIVLWAEGGFDSSAVVPAAAQHAANAAV